jgi:hypothetical protein
MASLGLAWSSDFSQVLVAIHVTYVYLLFLKDIFTTMFYWLNCVESGVCYYVLRVPGHVHIHAVLFLAGDTTMVPSTTLAVSSTIFISYLIYISHISYML